MWIMSAQQKPTNQYWFQRKELCCGRRTYSTIGTKVKYFLDGVYWSPLSICSHIFRLSYAPALNSNGIPFTQWNIKYDEAMYVRFVSVHDNSCDTPGRELYRIFNAIIIIGWINQAPIPISTCLFRSAGLGTHLLGWPTRNSNLGERTGRFRRWRFREGLREWCLLI